MVDEFAQLRNDIYLSHEAGNPEGYLSLARALCGGSKALDPLFDWIAALHANAQVRDAESAGGTRGPDSVPLKPGLIQCLGRSPYLDRYIADSLRGCPDAARQSSYLGERCSIPGRADFACAIAAGLTPFDAQRTAMALDGASDPDTLVDALAYVADAGLVELAPRIRTLLDGVLPWGVRAEALCALEDLESLEQQPAPQLPRDSGSGDRGMPPAGLAQSLFYGDPVRMGKGGSGGVGTLVRELGGALAAGGLPVLSFVCYNSRSCEFPLVSGEELSPGHVVMRLPIYLRAQSPAGFLAAEHRIARAVRRALRLNAGRVSMVHVRFIDDASRAVARVARECQVPLVTTLTPDPHRSICDAGGRIEPRPMEEAVELFHRILIGDDLLSWSRGILAIGRTAFSDSLIHYYPQLEDGRGKVMAAIDEGVNTAPAAVSVDAAALLCNCDRTAALSPAQLASPTLVSVGRLSPVKGQVNLVQAWAGSQMWRRYNLVLIGGDFETPSDEERRIRQDVLACLREELRGRLCHLPAQPNSVVRALLAWFARRRPPGGLDFYVCPSLKEEFGLSILEAMAEALPVCAPLRGGPPSYIRHGVNGFLIDTRNASTLRRELSAVLDIDAYAQAQLLRIKQQARRTVEERYSLASMAGDYQAFYRRVGTCREDGSD